MPQFDLTHYPAQIFWLFISFGFLYLMMRYLICPKIEKVLSLRENGLQQVLDQAEKTNAKAGDYHQKYQDFIDALAREKAEKIQKAYHEIQRQMRSMENRNENRLEEKIRRAERKIEDMTKELQSESDTVSKALAEQLADRIERESL